MSVKLLSLFLISKLLKYFPETLRIPYQDRRPVSILNIRGQLFFIPPCRRPILSTDQLYRKLANLTKKRLRFLISQYRIKRAQIKNGH